MCVYVYVCLSLSSKLVCSLQVKIRVMNNVVIVTYTNIGEDTLSEAILIVLDFLIATYNPMCCYVFGLIFVFVSKNKC